MSWGLCSGSEGCISLTHLSSPQQSTTALACASHEPQISFLPLKVPCPLAQPLPSAFLTNSRSTAQCKQPASSSGNLRIQQFPRPSRSKFRWQRPALSPGPGRVKRGKQKQVAIGALGAGFRDAERLAPRPGLLSRDKPSEPL